MPTREQLTTFTNDDPPAGADPWVPGQHPEPPPEVVAYDPAWPAVYADLEARIRAVLGARVLEIHHVGSTSVPGLAAKPVIDIDLIVADPDAEDAYIPPLVAAGFVHRIREPWWWGHRVLRLDDPLVHLHVFDFTSPEAVRHRLFRDWLRQHRDDRDRYAAAKNEASAASAALGEHAMEYNARKQDVVREIYARIFAATGLTD